MVCVYIVCCILISCVYFAFGVGCDYLEFVLLLVRCCLFVIALVLRCVVVRAPFVFDAFVLFECGLDCFG